jgi:pimeloyl-ACP methyl ester carboxylesterase
MLLLILVPVAALAMVRYAGWLKMRKTDREIKAYLGPHDVDPLIDTLHCMGRDIVYLRTSRHDKIDQAVLFVHGSPGSMDAYLDYMADTALLNRADLITFDRPGFGNSEFGVSEPSLARQAELVSEIMRQLGYKRYFLVGHSYGAPVILQAAVRHPEQVSGLCLIAGSVSPTLEPKNVSWRKWIDLPLLRELLPVSMRVSNEELMSLKQDLTMLEDDWQALSMPVSIIHGSADALVPFANLDYAKLQLVSSDSVLVKVFPGESHFILWTQQKEVSEELVKLLEVSSE